ncbi:MAG: Ycf48-like protein [Bacteroidia bacterium]|nr:Ycf48-like protein [Bacteroidia bacterium]
MILYKYRNKYSENTQAALRIFLLMVLTCGNIFNSFSQQWYLSPVFHSRHMYSVEILSRTHVIIGGGNESNASLQDIYKSTAGAIAWNFGHHTGGGYVRSVDFIDEQTGLAAGWRGTILKTTSFGYDWDSITPPANMDQRNFLKLLYRDAQNVLAFGGKNNLNDTMQTIIKSTDGGDTWSVVTDQQGRWIKDAHFINSTTGFAVGGKGTILKTVNGGNSWAEVNSPIDTVDFNAVYFIDANTGFVAGGNYAQFDTVNSTRTILKTIDGGNNWSIILNEHGGWLNDIEFSDANTGYIVGDAATLYKTTNGGNSWIRTTVDNSLWYSHFTSVKFLNNDFGIISGLFGEVFIYSTEPLPEVETLPVSITQVMDTAVNVVLRAAMNTHGNPVTYNMVYATQPDFSDANVVYLPVWPATFNSYLLQPVEATVHNLVPNTTYYYYVFARSVNGTVFGDTLSFYTGNVPYVDLHTYNPQTTPLYTVFSGNVGNPTVSMNMYFDYGLTPAMENTIQGNPFVINQQVSNSIVDTLSTLLADTIYYYRLKALTQTDTFYSNTISFFSGNLYSSFEATAATDVTETSATLNGFVEGLKLPMSYMSFQYGTDPDMPSSYMSIDHNFINDSLAHNVSVSINNLQPNTFYYYRLIGETSMGGHSSNVQSFYTGNIEFTFEAGAVTSVGQNSAILNGFAENFPFDANISFQYGTSPNYGTNVSATPSVLNDTLPHSFMAAITNLQPGTQYYYKMIAEFQSGYYFSNTETFSTAFQVNYFSTLPATEITEVSAKLNGLLNQFSFPVTLSFEYGLTENLGSEVQANPATVADTLQHFISADISGLLADTIYYFRVKAVSGIHTYYTETRQLYTGEPEIPNWNFEQWEPDTLILPAQWNILSDSTAERVPGHSGNYALKLSDTNFGMLGFPGDGSQNGLPVFYGGCPFTSRPDSVIFYLNYYLNPLDSGMFLLHLRNGNTVVSGEFKVITGNSGGNFQRFSFPVNYLSSENPDTMVVGFTTFSPFSSVQPDHTDNFMILDDISFYPPVSTSNCNVDFEDWIDFPFDNLKHWHYVKSIFIDPADIEGSQRVLKTEGYETEGSAVELRSSTYANLWLSGDISNNPNKDMFGGNYHGTPVSRRYQFLNGYYKYQPFEGDSLMIDVGMFKNTVAIGHGFFVASGTTNSFTSFDIPISYYDANSIPDSAIINIRNNNMGSPAGASSLVVDRLSFDGHWGTMDTIPGFESHELSEDIFIYPNPAKNLLVIELKDENHRNGIVSIVDMNGRVILQFNIPEGNNRITVDVSSVNAGIYFLQVLIGNRNYQHKKLVIVR